jgi:hypothetical protein
LCNSFGTQNKRYFIIVGFALICNTLKHSSGNEADFMFSKNVGEGMAARSEYANTGVNRKETQGALLNVYP